MEIIRGGESTCEGMSGAAGYVNQIVSAAMPSFSFGWNYRVVDAKAQKVKEKDGAVEFKLESQNSGYETKPNKDSGHYSEASDLNLIKKKVIEAISKEKTSIVLDGNKVGFTYERKGDRLENVKLSAQEGVELTMGFNAKGSRVSEDVFTAKVSVGAMATDLENNKSVDIAGNRYVYDEEKGDVSAYRVNHGIRKGLTLNYASAPEYADKGAITPAALGPEEKTRGELLKENGASIYTMPAMDANGAFEVKAVAPAEKSKR
jgi:hypothetical protein